MKLTWFGQSSWQIKTKAGKIIYLDPWMGNYENIEKADLILVSHSHHDHSDPTKLELIKKQETVVLTSHENAIKINGVAMAVGNKKAVEGTEIEAVPAYNPNKPHHPRGFGLGFVLTIEGKRIYFAGDTDLIEEMNKLTNIDLALLPIGGTYTMDTVEALKAIEIIGPKAVIPMHYNTPGVGLEADEKKFKIEVEKQTNTKVIILQREQSYEL